MENTQDIATVGLLEPLGKYSQYAFLLSAWAAKGMDNTAIAESKLIGMNLTVIKLY
jgi:hypothetical protein